MDLDDELRKLFSDDDRLDLHVSPKAEETVVRGAQRRRRRRGAAAGAFAVVALVGAGIGLLQLRYLPEAFDAAGPLLPTSSSVSSTPPPAPQVSTHTETVIVTVNPPVASGGNTNTDVPSKPPMGTNSSRPSVPEVGGWGKLKLAMSEADALKTGVLVEPTTAPNPDEKCRKYATQSAADADAVIISTVKGVVRITLPSYGRTTQGIGVDSKIADVKAAYPNAAQNGSELVVPMNATPKWDYVFENDGTVVTKVRMRLADNDCATA